jgi:NAD(P)-dependent dehydrogenase (short-subunit alcohol dehydrogenase family)
MGSGSTLRNALLIAQKRDKTLEDGLQIFASTSPQKRLIQLEEVADLIVILASISAKGIMGQPINVDGGAVMI